MKKTNAPARKPGGVNKDPKLRVKVPSLEYDVAVVKKKKKKKPLTEAESLHRRLSKSKEKTSSIIGDSAEDILQMLETGNVQQAVPLIYRCMLQTVVDVIPLAENAIRETKGAKGVYQLNSLISSLRELMADIQSAQDRGMLGSMIVDTILRPSYKDLAVSVLTEYKTLADDSKASLDALRSARASQEAFDAEWNNLRKNFQQSRERLAHAMQTQYKDSADKIVDYLQR